MFKGSNNKYNSFNEAKSTIINSALGKALSIASDATISTVASTINSVVNRGNLNWSGSNTTYSVSAGYYTGGTLDSRTSYNNGYSSGRTQGQNDVTGNPNGYGLYTKSQYDDNWSNGYNSGYSAGQSASQKIRSSSGTCNTGDATWTGWSGGGGNYNTIPIGSVGYQPRLCVCYCTTNSSHYTIRLDDYCISFGNGKHQITNTGSFGWSSSSLVMPTLRTSSVTYAWFCAGYAY